MQGSLCLYLSNDIDFYSFYKRIYMFTMHCHRFFTLFISFSLLIAPLPLPAMAEEIAINISSAEADIITRNADELYIYLGKELSNIGEIITQLTDFDEDRNSPLHALREHIANGFSLAEYDAVVETLKYAELLVERKLTQLDSTEIKQLGSHLDAIVDDVINDLLTVNREQLDENPCFLKI